MKPEEGIKIETAKEWLRCAGRLFQHAQKSRERQTWESEKLSGVIFEEDEKGFAVWTEREGILTMKKERAMLLAEEIIEMAEEWKCI